MKPATIKKLDESSHEAGHETATQGSNDSVSHETGLETNSKKMPTAALCQQMPIDYESGLETAMKPNPMSNLVCELACCCC